MNGLPVHGLIVRCAVVSENQSASPESEITSAIEMLRSIIPKEQLELLAPTEPATVYTTSITLWMLILQRLGKGPSLNTVVKDVLSNSRQLLPNNSPFANTRCRGLMIGEPSSLTAPPANCWRKLSSPKRIG